MYDSGTRPYYRESYTGKRIASIHNHADTELTVGLGEFVAVLNGVQFTTRHNDYELRMADFTNTSFLATTEIPFPDVPASVKVSKHRKCSICRIGITWVIATVGKIFSPLIESNEARILSLTLVRWV